MMDVAEDTDMTRTDMIYNSQQCDDCFITQQRVAAYRLQQPRPLYIFSCFILSLFLFLARSLFPFSSFSFSFSLEPVDLKAMATTTDATTTTGATTTDAGEQTVNEGDDNSKVL